MEHPGAKELHQEGQPNAAEAVEQGQRLENQSLPLQAQAGRSQRFDVVLKGDGGQGVDGGGDGAQGPGEDPGHEQSGETYAWGHTNITITQEVFASLFLDLRR